MTALRASPDRLHLACGYADGSIRVYRLQSSGSTAPVFELALHRSAVNVLRYDAAGLQLVTGGQDTDLVVVDTVERVGRRRLVGHSGAITDAYFYEPPGEATTAGGAVVISASKDTRIKFWDVQTQSCFRTVCDHRGDVWAMALLRDARYLVTGSAESTLNVYALRVRDATTTSAAAITGEGAVATEDGADASAEELGLAGPVECKLTGEWAGRIDVMKCTDCSFQPQAR